MAGKDDCGGGAAEKEVRKVFRCQLKNGLEILGKEDSDGGEG